MKLEGDLHDAEHEGGSVMPFDEKLYKLQFIPGDDKRQAPPFTDLPSLSLMWRIFA